MLILDEPTNHLDIESREALEDALRAFDGAVLLVSHDRALLDAVGTRTIAVEDHSLRSYVGGWPEYVRIREERRAAGEDGARAPRAAGRRARVRAGAPPTRRRPRAPVRSDAGNGAPRANGARRTVDKKGPSKNRLNAQAKAERTVEEAEAAMRSSRTSSPTRPPGRPGTSPRSQRLGTPPHAAPSSRRTPSSRRSATELDSAARWTT